jgi:hypothetical protein
VTEPGEHPEQPHPEPGRLPPAPPVAPTAGQPEQPRFLGRAAPLYGLVAGIVVYALGYTVALATGYDQQGYWALGWIAAGFLVSVVVLLIGLPMTIVVRTRGFGAGLLISMAIGLIVGSGVCIALLSSQ